jgi:preprotein translocase subunit YajC
MALASLGASALAAVGALGVLPAGASTVHSNSTKHPIEGVNFAAIVAGVSSTSFQVWRAGALVTVNVASKTAYSEKGVTGASLADIAKGETVLVDGTITGKLSVVNAETVTIRPFPSVEFVATVTALGSGTFTVMRGTTPVTVDVSSRTAYSDPAVKSPTFGTLMVGQQVVVHGTTNAPTDTAINAMLVQIEPMRTGFFGTVSTIGNGVFTVYTANGPVTINVSPKTAFAEPGPVVASFSDLTVGARLLLNVDVTSNPTVFNALSVAIVHS